MVDFDSLEKKWREAQNKRNFGKEILETMSYEETRELLTPLFEELIRHKHDFDKLYKLIKNIVQKYHAPDTVEHNFCLDAVWLLRGANEEIENETHLKDIETLYIWNESRKPNTSKNQLPHFNDYKLLIYSAKQIPIEKFFKNPLKKTGSNRLTGLCPFHQEKHASFTIYTDSNNFYCYGCHSSGDSIGFYQKLYGLSFWDTVKQMTGVV